MPLHRMSAVLGLMCLAGSTAWASDLSYTFMDVQVLDTRMDLTAVQFPVPEQSVTVTTRGGDGVAVAGSVALRERFYLAGSFSSSIIDVDALVESPLASAEATGRFDLVFSNLGFGYQRELARTFDIFAEINYHRADYDFGSFAGEDFSTRGSGAGGRLGFRWNPVRAFELFGAARHSPVAKPDLSTGQLSAGTDFSAGMRWYFFEDLGVGLDYQSGDVEAVTLSLRFSFGNLPW
jgi:hypothetical protein